MSGGVETPNRLVYQIIKSRALTKGSFWSDLVAFCVCFRAEDIFVNRLISDLDLYTRYCSCECGASAALQADSINERNLHESMALFQTGCRCESHMINLSRVSSPDFFGTTTNSSSYAHLDAGDLRLNSTFEEADEDEMSLFNETADPDCHNPTPAGPTEKVEQAAGQVMQMLKEISFYQRMTSDQLMTSCLSAVIDHVLAIDDPLFLKKICGHGRLYRELVVRQFTKLQGSAPKLQNSLLAQHAGTETAKYIMGLWNPDQEHDFVYRASVKMALDADNDQAFRLLSPKLTFVCQQTYRPKRYILSELVRNQCWRILHYIMESDIIGRELSSMKHDCSEEVCDDGAASPRCDLMVYKQMLGVVSNSIDFSLLLNRTTDRSEMKEDLGVSNTAPVRLLVNPLFEYLMKYLPVPTWLSTQNGKGSGTYLVKYYQVLRPAAVDYVLTYVQPGTINWRDAAQRTIATELRWGNQGREKLMLLLKHGLTVPRNVYEGILIQKQYWKLSNEDLEFLEKQVIS